MLTNLFNLRKVAIIAAVLAVGWGGHIKIKNIQVSYYKSKAVKLEAQRDAWKEKHDTVKENHKEAVKANQSNQEAIAKLEKENQQCALSRELNETHAAKELTRHQGRIADIKDKYDKLKKNLSTTGCAAVAIGDDILQAISGQRD